jgi:large subunit ribosomal protein L28
MSRSCEVTGKKTRFGRNVPRKGMLKRKGGAGQHVGVTTQRKFKVNLHTKTVYINGVKRRMRVSARGLRTLLKTAR